MRRMPLSIGGAAPLLHMFVVGVVMVGGGMLWPEAAEARTKHYKWAVDYRFWAPDCVEKMIISINGQYPGPTIRARVGDVVVVELTNLMPTETVLLHWHGILQVYISNLSFLLCCLLILILILILGHNESLAAFRVFKCCVV